jgi:hypothetical protein
MEHEGSKLVVAITANMEDYLATRGTGKVVEGEKGFKNTEKLWTFIVQNGQWVVANIEESSLSLDYAQADSKRLETTSFIQAKAF